MLSTGRRDLIANRWEPFVHTIDFVGVDYGTAAFIAQIRLMRDTSGTPLVDLATVGSVGTQGITIVAVTTDTGGVPTTATSLRINEATMESLPLPAEIGNDLDLYWDLQITPSGGTKFRCLEGLFTVHAGVTH